jgi:alpha-N-arabinofuranosidase
VIGGRDTTVVLASKPWTSARDPILLRIDARGDRYDFYYAARAGAWTALATDADGTMLSTRIASGFVGTMLGMYAFSSSP